MLMQILQMHLVGRTILEGQVGMLEASPNAPVYCVLMGMPFYLRMVWSVRICAVFVGTDVRP